MNQAIKQRRDTAFFLQQAKQAGDANMVKLMQLKLEAEQAEARYKEEFDSMFYLVTDNKKEYFKQNGGVPPLTDPRYVRHVGAAKVGVKVETWMSIFERTR